MILFEIKFGSYIYRFIGLRLKDSWVRSAVSHGFWAWLKIKWALGFDFYRYVVGLV